MERFICIPRSFDEKTVSKKWLISALPAIVVVTVLTLTPSAAPAQDDAADKRGGFWERVRLGATVMMYTGQDKIRSNSGNLVSVRDIQLNDTALRFEPRVEVATGRLSLSPVRTGGDLQFRVLDTFIRDPRKDVGAVQNNAVEETAWIDLSAAYDIRTWKGGTLYGQFNIGYYSGDIGAIEVALDLADQPNLNPETQDVTASDPLANYQFVYPTAGTLEQTPVSFAGMWQFRPRSPFRPYIGLGLGWLETDISDSPSLDRLNDQLAGIEYTWRVRGALQAAGALPEETIVVETTSDHMWVALGGLEYNINRNWSIYLDTKYIGTNAKVTMKSCTDAMCSTSFERFGEGISRSENIFDVEGIGTEELFIEAMLALPVDEAVLLVADITDTSSIPEENEVLFNRSFPVVIGSEISLEIPNPAGSGSQQTSRISKLFVLGGDVELSSYSVGFGFRYRY